MEATVSISRWMDKEDVVICAYNGILLSHKSNERAIFSLIKENKILSFAATWVNLEIIILSEVKERQIYEVTYM